jgi:hypothetical protein
MGKIGAGRVSEAQPVEQEWWKQVPPLRLDREGRWYDQGARVTNARLAEFLLTHLGKDEDGRYLVEVGRDRRYVDVEDAPYRALGIEVGEGQSPPERLFVRLNDGKLELFDPATFWIDRDGTPYCLVRDRAHKVKFTAESYRQLSAFIIEETDGGGHILQVGTHKIPVSVPGR